MRQSDMFNYTPLDNPLTKCTFSASETFNDMVEGEVRYFDIQHLQLFRVFAARWNGVTDSVGVICTLQNDENTVSVMKEVIKRAVE